MGYKYPWTYVLLLTFDNSLLFTESIQNTTQIFHWNHNVRFLPCQHRQHAMPCTLNPVHRFNYSRTLPQKFPVRAGDIIREYNDDSSHLTYINKYLTIWNFNSLFRVCLIFLHIRFCELQKASGITPWKKMLLATALALLITGCSTDVYCSKQTGKTAAESGASIIHHFFCLELGRRNCRCSQNLWRRRKCC